VVPSSFKCGGGFQLGADAAEAVLADSVSSRTQSREAGGADDGQRLSDARPPVDVDATAPCTLLAERLRSGHRHVVIFGPCGARSFRTEPRIRAAKYLAFSVAAVSG
jgi:hypothetical protein